jgi:putative intracellular protease/amidase
LREGASHVRNGRLARPEEDPRPRLQPRGVRADRLALLKARLSNGDLLVGGKTWTGFANSEEDYADEYVGRRIQPFRIEDEARALPDTNFVVAGRFRPHAVRDGLLVTGQQQYSGAAVARLVIEALGR